MTVIIKESVSSDGQQFHQYQENGQNLKLYVVE